MILGRSDVFVATAFALVACSPRSPLGSAAPTEPAVGPPTVFIEAHAPAEQSSLSLDQAVFDPGAMAYVFGHPDGMPNIAITGAPRDADPTRMAMLHDGAVYRLYLFKLGSDDTIYQFGFNPATSAYEFGFQSIPQLTLAGAPADASADSFAMLHDGTAYRLYLRSKTRDTVLYQFAYNQFSQQYEHGYDSIPALELVGSPIGADHRSWAMLHDGRDYRYYAGGRDSTIYQFAYNRATGSYEFGFNSIPELRVVGAPPGGEARNFSMLHDGAHYRLYFMTRG